MALDAFLLAVTLGGTSLGIDLPTAGAVIVAALLVAVVLIFIFRKFIVNSILGVLALLALNYLGVKIAVNVLTVIICGLLGLAGVGLLLVLKLLGVPL